MKDFKNHGQDIIQNAYIAHKVKVQQRTTLALSVLGSLCGAVIVYSMVTVLFAGAL